MWPLIDSHCHIDAPEFDLDRPAVIASALASGVEQIVVPAYIASKWPSLLTLCHATTALTLWPALGLHPVYLQQHQATDLALLERLLMTYPEVVAIGEIGLDRFVPELMEAEAWQRQVTLFEAQLALAQAQGKPIIIHARRCHAAIVASIRRVGFMHGGIVHAFSGSLDEALLYTRLGFCVGIGGAMTYASARRIRAVAAALPLSAMVLETDAPDMLPSAHQPITRGERARNEPAYLANIFSELCTLRLETPTQLADALRRNTQRVLRLPA